MLLSPPFRQKGISNPLLESIIVDVSDSRHNFIAFLWHALFLAFVTTFIDVNTVFSSLVLKIGGSSFHVGILTGIAVGLPLVTQLLFAGFLAGRPRKKPFLLLGIYLRVFSLAGMAYTLAIAEMSDPSILMFTVFFWVGLFATSGAFAGISYTDILGKALPKSERRRFLISKQAIASGAMLISAILVRHLVIALPYPRNYTVIFLMAAVLLFIATGGFWAIRELPGKASPLSRMLTVLKAIPQVLKSDKNLSNYILLINTSSLGLTIIPFYIAISKGRFGLSGNQIGNYLLLQFVGMALSTIIWKKVANKYKFKGISFCYALIGGLLPPLALALSRTSIDFFQWIFFFSGFVVSAGRISIEGILLEISTNDNRAVYAGISGTLSLTTAIFPLIAGMLIEKYSFSAVFMSAVPIIFSSIFLLRRIQCKP
jgi:MFS family permease